MRELADAKATYGGQFVQLYAIDEIGIDQFLGQALLPGGKAADDGAMLLEVTIAPHDIDIFNVLAPSALNIACVAASYRALSCARIPATLIFGSATPVAASTAVRK